MLLAAGTIGVLLAGLATAYAAYSVDDGLPDEGIALCTPEPKSGWRLSNEDGAWQAIFPSADARLSQRYRIAGEQVDAELYLAFYWQQSLGAELVDAKNRLTDNKTWKWLSGLPLEIEVEGQPVIVTEARLLAEKTQRRLVWHWYWVDGRFTSDHLLAKLLQAKVALLGGEPRSAFIAVTTEEREGTATARRVLASLAAGGLALSPALQASGPGAC